MNKIAVQIFILLIATNCSAVRRPVYQTALPDTLPLSQEKYSKFIFRSRAGADLENLGLGLTAASVVSPYILYSLLSKTRFNDDGISMSISALAIFPTAVSVMALGNHIYGKAASMDTNNVYSISSPYLPYLVYASTLINYAILLKYLSCSESESESRSRCTSGPVYAIPFITQVVLVPILRKQFNRAEEILRNVEVVVDPETPKINFTFSF